MKTTYYLIEVEGGVEPCVHGPYQTEEERDNAARQIHKDLGENEALFWANVDRTARLIVGSYPSRFFCGNDWK